MKTWIEWGAACALLVAAPAFAGTSANTQLCWGASGIEGSDFTRCTNTYDGVTGQTTSVVEQTLPNPDGTSPDQHFLGQASATATADTWRVSTSLTLANYRRDNYIWTESPTQGTYAATTAVASANTTDTVTITGGTGVYRLKYILSLDGLLGSTDTSLLSSSFCASLYIPDGTGTANFYCQSAGQATPSSITLSYDDLPFGGPVTPTLSISAYGFVTPLYASQVGALGADTFSAGGYVQFGSTVHLTSLLVTDAAGNPIPGLSIESGSGYTYPLDPQNTAPVPEPTAACMLAAGLAGLLLRRRRARPGP
jgi:hypothetical protein